MIRTPITAPGAVFGLMFAFRPRNWMTPMISTIATVAMTMRVSGKRRKRQRRVSGADEVEAIRSGERGILQSSTEARCFRQQSAEDHRAVSVEQYPPLDVPRHGPRQHQALDIAPGGCAGVHAH